MTPANKASSPNRILVLGLNPAWQKVLVFPELTVGEVNRAASVFQSPAGKGVNFAKAAKSWGSRPTVCQFVGGGTGENMIRELTSRSIGHISVNTKDATRVCTTCICRKSGDVTELVEPASPIPASAVRTLKKSVLKNIASFKGIALCGTYPDGVGPDFFADVAAAAGKRGIPVLLDGVSGIRETLERGVGILKVNRGEFLRITGEKDIFRAARSFFRKYHVGMAAITAGPSKAFLFEKDCGYEFSIPYTPGVINPIGAGDTVSGVFFCEILKGTPPPDAFRLALGAGTASCLNLLPAEFEAGEARNIATKIKCFEKR